MGKKIFFTLSFFLSALFCIPQFVFAEAEEALTQEEATVQMDEKISEGLETFFEKTLSQDYEAAYKMMTDDFIKNTSFEDFKLMLTETRLTVLTQKTWTDFKKEMLGILATARGDFTSPNSEIRHLTFEIFVDAHEIKIRAISESISMQDLKKRFLAKERLQSQVEKELNIITDFLQARKTAELYAYLSSNPNSRIKKTDIFKMIASLKKSKLSVEMEQNTPILIRNNIHLNPEGSMVVRGVFHNSTAKIYFMLNYNYQWKWKLEKFRFTIAKNK